MKKIYFLLVAAFLCMSASAATTLYLRGDMNDWKTDMPFVEKDGKYVVENVTIKSGNKMKVADSNYGTAYGEWDGIAKNMKGDNSYRCHKGGGDMSFAEDFTGNVEFIIEENDWATIKFIKVAPPENYDFQYRFHGNLTGDWDSEGAAETFVEVDGVLSYGPVKVTNDKAEFGVRSYKAPEGTTAWTKDTWYWAAAGTTITETTDVTLKDGGSGANPKIAKGTWTFTLNPETLVLTCTKADQGTEPDSDPDPDPVVASYWLSGAFTGWEEGEIELKEENAWTATANCANTDPFGIRTRDAQGEEILFYMVLNASELDADATLEMVPEKTVGAACPSVKRGFWSFTLDSENMTLSVKKVSDYKMTYELRGIGGNWGTCQTAYAEGTIVKFVVEKWAENDGFKVWYYNDGSEHWKGVNTSDALQNGAWEAAGNNNAKLDPSADGKTVTIRFATDTESIKASWPETHQVRIAFDNGETQWDNVYAYFHVDGEAQHDWKAYKLTDTRENAAEQPEVSILAVSDLKYCDVDLDFVPSHVVFHNGGIGSGNQTVDLVYKNNMTFAPSGQNDDGHYIVPDENVTGIESIINNADAAPVYYNLQGVRVDAPAQGLYIVVRGNKVAKEIVK